MTKEEANRIVDEMNSKSQSLFCYCPLTKKTCLRDCLNFRKAYVVNYGEAVGYHVHGGDCAYFDRKVIR